MCRHLKSCWGHCSLSGWFVTISPFYTLFLLIIQMVFANFKRTEVIRSYSWVWRFYLIHEKIFKIDWGKELAWSNLLQLCVLFCSGSIRWALVKESPWVISCGCQGFCFTVLQKILVTRSLLTLNPCQETGMELERTPTIGEACIVQSGSTD